MNEDSPRTILLVDDDAAVLRFLRSLLQEEGYLTQEAVDGKAALALLADPAPDLVLSDVNMPQLDGGQLCRAMKAAPAYAAIPIVLMSVDVNPIAGLEVQPNGVLRKPIDIDGMLLLFDRLLAERNSTGE